VNPNEVTSPTEQSAKLSPPSLPRRSQSKNRSEVARPIDSDYSTASSSIGTEVDTLAGRTAAPEIVRFPNPLPVQFGYFGEPQVNPNEVTTRQSKWSSISAIYRSNSKDRSESARPRDSGYSSISSSPSYSGSPRHSKRSSEASGDVGRHGNEWLFGGHRLNDLKGAVSGLWKKQ
jgi:hypothetical protein